MWPFKKKVDRYIFYPRPDITAYELARCIFAIVQLQTRGGEDIGVDVIKNNPSVNRHFIVNME